ncbi:MAG TPA: CocE/NonD family hydrolase, partial [Blastocatellia bacterium]|nr:CocE/NonD family hydrolase [Blastocatellia bacterium]
MIRANWIRWFNCLLVIVGFLPVFQSVPESQHLNYLREHYTKYEYNIPMRDGVKLFTSIYVPKDSSQKYPFLLKRTPYSVRPYGVDRYQESGNPVDPFQKEGFIFVNQDARGRYLSEGEFQQVRPAVSPKRGPQDIDESTDTYDTIEWLLKNIPNHNGRVGMIGISQPGFHVAASLIDSHPALKCASPQAPTADYYLGDDVYHNGAFMLAANFWFYSGFRPRGPTPHPPQSSVPFDSRTPDGYAFFLNLGPLAEVNQRLFNGEARYWQEIVDHPNYDDFWKGRSLSKFMKNVKCAVLNVGGWFDAEDPMGPFHIYRAVEKGNSAIANLLVMGPWSHGGWARGDGERLGNLSFGQKTGVYFREQIQFPFFMHYLKDKPADLPEAYMYLTGINEWRRHADWPPKEAKPLTLYFQARGGLSEAAPPEGRPSAFDEYISDPNRPVPYLSYIVPGMTSDYMTEDQRFASQRTDVLVYQTPALEEDLTIAGPIKVSLNVSTSGTDSDFVVKLIDVYPGDYPDYSAPNLPAGQAANAVRMGGYQQLVRGEPFRAKFRNGFERPEPM